MRFLPFDKTQDNFRTAEIAVFPFAFLGSKTPSVKKTAAFHRHKLHRKGVNTMTTVCCGKAFSEENVAQMSAAVDTLDFRPLTIGIG